MKYPQTNNRKTKTTFSLFLNSHNYFEVVPQRVVIDRNRITGAGVTSGIDFGLILLDLLCGEDVAKMTQLMMEYSPQPPFKSGTPDTADPQTIECLLDAGKPLINAFRTRT